MSIVTEQIAREHCKITDSSEDIAVYLSAAEQIVQDYIGCNVYATQEMLETATTDGVAGVNPIVTTAAINAAILLVFGDLYRDRESTVVGRVSVSELPLAWRRVLSTYRTGRGV